MTAFQQTFCGLNTVGKVEVAFPFLLHTWICQKKKEKRKPTFIMLLKSVFLMAKEANMFFSPLPHAEAFLLKLNYVHLKEWKNIIHKSILDSQSGKMRV